MRMWNLRGKWAGPYIILLAWIGRVKVIGRTVFIAPTWEPLIPVKSPEKRPILTASHRSVKSGKLRDVKILNHVLLTDKILIRASGPHRIPFFLLKKDCIWGTVWQGVWSLHTQEHWSRPVWWDQECLSLLQPMGTGAAHSKILRALQEDC